MSQYKIALDIGATKTLAGLVDSKNKVIKKIKKPTEAKKSNKIILQNIENIIIEIAGNKLKNISQIGIGFAGQIDTEKGVIISTTNFAQSFRNINLKKILETKFNIPTIIDNDVKALAKAEIKYGYGLKYNNFISLTFGTGIGGSIVIDKQLYSGQNNLAGEMGHMNISGFAVDKFKKTNNKSKQAWENLASGNAWWYIKEKYSTKEADKIITYNIVEGLSNLATIFDPQIFILGGGLMNHPGLLKNIQQKFKKNNFHPYLNKIKITKTKLKDNSILLGSLLK